MGFTQKAPFGAPKKYKLYNDNDGGILTTITLFLSASLSMSYDLHDCRQRAKVIVAVQGSIVYTFREPQRGYLCKTHSVAQIGANYGYDPD